MNNVLANISDEELHTILHGDLNENHNQLSIFVLRDIIKNATENESLDADFVSQQFQILKDELNNPSASIYSDEIAENLNQDFNLDIDDTRTVNSELKFSDKVKIQELEIFKSPEELTNEYLSTVERFKKNHPEEYKKNAVLVAQLYDGAIQNYRQRMAKQYDETKAADLIERITKLYNLKAMYPQYEVDIAKLLAKVAFVAELYNRSQDGEYIFDVLSKSEENMFEFLSNLPEIKAITDVHKFINATYEDEEIKNKEQDEIENQSSINLRSSEVVSDYSQEKISLNNQSISKKIFNIATATGEKINTDDPVLIAAYNEAKSKLEKELDSFSPKKVELYKKYLGNDWKNAYIEAYTEGWNKGIEDNINRAYNAGLEFRNQEIKRTEESFSFKDTLDSEALEQVSTFAQSCETNSPEEELVQSALVSLDESRKEKNLPKFEQAQDIIDQAATNILSHSNSLDEKQRDDYINNLSALNQSAVYLSELGRAVETDARLILKNFIGEITASVQEKESHAK